MKQPTTKVVGNKGSKFYGRYVTIEFKQQDGQFLCKFTGEHAAEPTISFEEIDLITIAEYKKRKMDEDN